MVTDLAPLYCIDISNINQYFLEPGATGLTQRQLDAMFAAGVRVVIVGCQFPSNHSGNADRNLTLLKLDGRFRVQVYFESQAPYIAWAHISQFADIIEFYWVAFELVEYSGCQDEATLDEWLKEVDELTGKLTGVYSSKYMWDQMMDSSITKYADAGRLLGNAYYDGVSDNFVLPQPFAGWARCAWDQSSEKTEIENLPYLVDSGAIDPAAFNIVQQAEQVTAAVTEQAEEDDMSKARELTQDEKIEVGFGAADFETLMRGHFSDLVNDQPGDGYDVKRIESDENDVIVYVLPKGSVFKA